MCAPFFSRRAVDRCPLTQGCLKKYNGKSLHGTHFFYIKVQPGFYPQGFFRDKKYPTCLSSRGSKEVLLSQMAAEVSRQVIFVVVGAVATKTEKAK